MQQSIRIGVFGAVNGWYFKDLQRVANALGGFEILPLDFTSLQVSNLSGSAAHACRLDSPDERVSLKDLDALLVRAMPLGSLEQIIFRMNALHVAEQMGVPVLNSPRCLEICIDKWLTLQKVQLSGIPTPRTVCCQTRDDAMEAWSNLGGDCVVKPIFGGEGRGIVRVTDSDMAWRVFSTLEQLQAVHYVQEYIENDGSDLRCLVIDEAIYCMRRTSRGGWRANVAQGGTGAFHEPTFEEVDLAYRAAKGVGGWMVGVDLLEDLDGQLMLLEVNAVPGWRATAQAVGVDLAQELLVAISTKTIS